MNLSRRDFLKSLGYALRDIVFNELFGRIENIYRYEDPSCGVSIRW